jgi:hypothetical protein
MSSELCLEVTYMFLDWEERAHFCEECAGSITKPKPTLFELAARGFVQFLRGQTVGEDSERRRLQMLEGIRFQIPEEVYLDLKPRLEI